MNLDPGDLYQDVVLEHGQRPRNFRRMKGADGSARGFNPLCGDELTVYVRRRGEVLEDLCFEGAGCAISKASASLMTAGLKGRTVAEAALLFERFLVLVTRGPGAVEDLEALGKLVVLSGVSQFPSRVKCASLPWHTLRSALAGQRESVSTE
jgi:nitrogen fixation NifU-like protein